ncbi:MAG: glycosyl hydrolase [Verrucomicrobiae bacterium]
MKNTTPPPTSAVLTFSKRSGKNDTQPIPRPDRLFPDPDTTYAPSVFWLWNSTLPPERISDMAAEICRQRLNPGYVHARFTPEGDRATWNEESWKQIIARRWISDEWFNAFEASLEKTAAAGMHMTYTTGEPNIPKHQILAVCPELKAQSVGAAIVDVEGNASHEVPESFFTVAAKVEGGRIVSSSLQIVGEGAPFVWEAPEGATWRLYVFTKYHDVTSSGAPVNFLDRRLGDAWIEVEHSKYEARVGQHFGKTMGGIFIDHEGCYGYKLAWSDDLAKDYSEKKGRDIRLWMPLMVDEDVEGKWGKARWDWFDTITRLYAECLMAPMDQWCRDRNMYVTCHFWESSLFEQAIQAGSFFHMQRSYSFPGTDALFLQVLEPRHFKETQSVCEFEGRQSFSEMLTIAGWHVTPATLKKSANCGIAWGLTQLTMHSINTNTDLLKVSYPPDSFNWNPCWRHLHLMTDFVRRAAHVNDHGRLRPDVLVFCPMDSVWALLGDGIFDPAKPHHFYFEDMKGLDDARHADEIRHIDAAYTQAQANLSAGRVEYLIADHVYLEQMDVSVEGRLTYGGFAFQTLVLPPLYLIPLEVARKAVAFAQSGGRVYALGRLPEGSVENGMYDPGMKRLMDVLRAAPGFVEANEGLAAWIGTPDLPQNVVFETGAFPMLSSQRTINGRSFTWLVNNESARQECVVRIRAASGEASIWNCETGTKTPIASEDLPSGESRVTLTLEPYEAFWLVHDPSKPVIPPSGEKPSEQTVLTLDGLWTVSVDAADQPAITDQQRIAAPAWLLEGGSQRPLESWLAWELQQFSGFVDYATTFEIDRVEGSETLNLGEVSYMAEVWINGQPAGGRLWAPFQFEIGKWLRPGSNTVRIRVGNLVLNAISQYNDYKWNWYKAPDAKALDAGLFGPVTVQRRVTFK